ncbi:hypothetical protein STEG23_013257, partial [Scotinomys teguina]
MLNELIDWILFRSQAGVAKSKMALGLADLDISHPSSSTVYSLIMGFSDILVSFSFGFPH